MKQSAAKTLGVAALGAAFAAAAAGTSSAAALPDLTAGTGALDTVTNAAPVQEAVDKLPAGAATSLAGGRMALGAVDAARTAAAAHQSAAKKLPAAQQPAAKALPADGLAPVTGLLGGMPIGGGLLPGLG
ncbi:hypothetical protein [Streptomyces sp. NPDC058572]|uniref:hypothetical protein n=1 Tax=Streptomyces sp. NPDC058572 TaxID=3346546 RepID=UPI003663E7A5